MPFFGPKRGRTTRVIALRPATNRIHELIGILTDRHVAIRLLLCLLATAAMVVAIQAWKFPFRYRLGQRVAHGIAQGLDFERDNPVATERARELKAAQVPHIFRHDHKPLKLLPAQLTAAPQAGRRAQSPWTSSRRHAGRFRPEYVKPCARQNSGRDLTFPGGAIPGLAGRSR